MRRTSFFQILSTTLLMLILCTWLAGPAPVSALNTSADQTPATTSIRANIYLTGTLLQPLFQHDVNAQLPQVLAQAIGNMESTIPQQAQGWATQMANALLQPSAVILNIVPQSNGLLVTFNVSLYPGDPHPTTMDIAIGLRVLDASTIQITALPNPDGQPGVLTGPLTIFHMTMGTLNAIAATPQCGDADLNISLQYPLASSQSQTAFAPTTSSVQPLAMTTEAHSIQPFATSSEPTGYVELPASSLAQLGQGIGSLAVGSGFTATNIRLSVQSHNLLLTTDLLWQGLGIGTAVSTLLPGASHGNLVLHVQHTNLQLANGLLTFPLNNYNQQIEQAVNAKLNGALTGKFTVTQATIGGNANISCIASNSLLMGGQISLN